MSKIFISRNREQLGEFSEEDVVHGLMNGRFSPSDLAWREGMDAWRPLEELQLVEKAASQRPLTALSEPEGFPSHVGAPTPGGPPWEAEGEGLAKRWWETSFGAIFSPISTFSQMKVTGGFGAPLLYYFLCALLAGLFYGIIQVVIVLVMLGMGMSAEELQAMGLMTTGSLVLSIPITLISAILGAAMGCVFGAFVGGGIVHLCLMLLGAANRGYEGTVRAICYSGGAIQVMALVPVLGWLGAIIWGPVMYVIALKEAHQSESWRVIIAVLLPMLVCCGLVLVLAMAVGGLAAAAARGM